MMKLSIVATAALAAAFAAEGADARYLRYTPEQYRAMVPRHSAAPTMTEAAPYATSGNDNGTCPVCGKSGKMFDYDLLADPEKVTCAATGRDLMSVETDGEDEFTDWRGESYKVAYAYTPYVKDKGRPSKKVKYYPANIVAREKILCLIGHYGGGALPILADGFAETGDEAYAERAIAILEGFADVFPSWPWTGHAALVPHTRADLEAAAKRHDSGYHGWQGPARLAAGITVFPNPAEAIFFTRMARAFKALEKSKSWNGRREKILRDLFREGAVHFHAYGAKQCVANAIGMYAPALYELGTILGDDYLLGGFHRIMEDFLYNENHYDGLSTEGSPDYARMVSGMWKIYDETGLSSNAAYRAKHPFLAYAGKTWERVKTSRGGLPALGDHHANQYEVREPPAKERIPGGEFGGWGLSVVRAGAPSKRLDLYFSHRRTSGHCHDDTLGLQFFYRGIPLVEQFGDTRNTADLTDKIPGSREIAALAYPAPFVTADPRPRGFSLQDMTTGLTKNLVIVDDYWANNSWYTAYRGGQGVDRRAPYGQLNARTGRAPESDLQFVEAHAADPNSTSYQGVDVYRRAICVVTRSDGTPYVVDFFSVSGGHRHLFLLHSRGRETASTLGRGERYAHLDKLPCDPTAESFIVPAGSVMFPSNVFNNVDLGPETKGTWRHEWEFDYTAWASKTHPPAKELVVEPHVLTVYGFHSPKTPARAVRADGHYPVTIEEKIGRANMRQRFQFENAVHYAGLRAESRSRLRDTYIQVYEMRGKSEPRAFADVKRIVPDDGDTFAKAAVAIRFADGSADVVIWQSAARPSSWKGGRIRTDARAALLRLGGGGKVAAAKMAGGTFVDVGGRRVASAKKGAYVAHVVAAKDGELVLSGAGDWPVGEAWKGRTVRVDFPFGDRREAFMVDRIERDGEKTRVVLAGAPFFTYHRGEVLDVDDPCIVNHRQFIGTTVQKGGQTSRYLHGAKLTIPEIGFSAHVGGVACQSGHDRERFAVQEDVDLKSAGLKKGMTFLISPDWSSATAQVMEETP